MPISAKTRRTWKRALKKTPTLLLKENSDQKIEKTLYREKQALLITYKKDMTLKDLSFIKRSVDFLCDGDLPFSRLHSFDRTKEGYSAIWSFCEGKIKEKWSIKEFQQFGEFLGKMHLLSRMYEEPYLGKPPLLFSLREKYEELKESIPISFDLIPTLIKTIEEKWPIFLPTGLVHTDLFPTNILFKEDKISGILQNHQFQIDVLLYDLTYVIKALYLSSCTDKEEKSEAFFNAYTQHLPLSSQEFQSLSVLTAAKLLHTSLFLIEKHLYDVTYCQTHLNSAAISLIHAEKALLLFLK